MGQEVRTLRNKKKSYVLWAGVQNHNKVHIITLCVINGKFRPEQILYSNFSRRSEQWLQLSLNQLCIKKNTFKVSVIA